MGMTKHPTLTKADLIEEVLRISELPRKESETIVETSSRASLMRCKRATKSKFAVLGVFARDNGVGA